MRDDNDRAYAVAGFLGHQRDCVHLHWAWKERLLDKYGLEYFKASGSWNGELDNSLNSEMIRRI